MANTKKSACGYCVSHSTTNHQIFPKQELKNQRTLQELQRRERQLKRKEAGAAGKGAPIEVKIDHDVTK